MQSEEQGRRKSVDPLQNRRGLTPGGPPRGQTGNRKRFLSIYVNSAIWNESVYK